MNIPKPGVNETNVFYDRYIDLVNETDLIPALHHNQKVLSELFGNIPSEIEVFRYDTHKWSIKEVLMHIIDFERYLGFKAFVSLRHDTDTIIYHPQRDKYLFNAATETRTLKDLLPEFNAVRTATISMFNFANSSQLAQTGNHENNTNHAVSARALGYAIVGHALHHMQVISERYLRLSDSRRK